MEIVSARTRYQTPGVEADALRRPRWSAKASRSGSTGRGVRDAGHEASGERHAPPSALARERVVLLPHVSRSDVFLQTCVRSAKAQSASSISASKRLVRLRMRTPSICRLHPSIVPSFYRPCSMFRFCFPHSIEHVSPLAPWRRAQETRARPSPRHAWGCGVVRFAGRRRR